ncbi:hypothetical protein ACQPYK_49550 (plasmid) [Streptosporangium sp. CA-135522]|uniref:hypothetical protein n=1 Tax=Streptosporangium sp. CA-135522 TaxID=3240072 RepID=UPI003D89C3CD
MEVRDRVSDVEQRAQKIFEDRMPVIRELAAATAQLEDIDDKIANLGKDRAAIAKTLKQLYEQAVREGWRPENLGDLGFESEPGRSRGRPRTVRGKQRRPRTVRKDSAAADTGLELDPALEGDRQGARPPAEAGFSWPSETHRD